MKRFPIINCGSLALATLMVTAVVPAKGQGTLVIQHSGATDPLTEGWSGFGGYPITNDLGVNAWVTPGFTNQQAEFNYVLTPQQQAASFGSDWILSADLKIATTNSFDFFGVDLQGYNGGYGLSFGSDSNGDQYVVYSATGSITLPGSNYNLYQLRYDASADEVSLWINDVEYANDLFTNQHETYLIEMGWGGAAVEDGTKPLANWSLVSLTIPEPSSAAVLLLGCGVLFYLCKRRPC